MEDTEEQKQKLVEKELLGRINRILAEERNRKPSPEISRMPELPPDPESLEPATKKQTWVNLMTLEKEYRQHGAAGLKNAYDRMFPEE